VQGNCAIELKLDQCLHRMMSQVKRQASNGNAARLVSVPTQQQPRIPSWLHLPALPAFSASVRMWADEAEDTRGEALPLSRYVHDDALMEAALHDSHAAQLLTEELNDDEEEVHPQPEGDYLSTRVAFEPSTLQGGGVSTAERQDELPRFAGSGGPRIRQHQGSAALSSPQNANG
jgi:hypothetical protein